MEDGDAEGSVLGLARAAPPRARSCVRLSAPPWWRNGRAELSPTTCRPGAEARRLGRLPDPLELRPRAHEARRRVREVVVAGHGEHRRPERAQQLRGALELLPAAAVREIAGRDHELGLEPLHEPRQRLLDLPLRMCTRVQVGYMEEPRGHNRTRL